MADENDGAGALMGRASFVAAILVVNFLMYHATNWKRSVDTRLEAIETRLVAVESAKAEASTSP